MTQMRRKLGAEAESIAARHLEKAGMRIVERNWRGRLGEIDIVAEDRGTTVIVEVRARRAGGAAGHPFESIGPTKQRRLVRLAHLYAAARGLAGRPIRIDCVAVIFGPRVTVERIENAVEDFA